MTGVQLKSILSRIKRMQKKILRFSRGSSKEGKSKLSKDAKGETRQDTVRPAPPALPPTQGGDYTLQPIKEDAVLNNGMSMERKWQPGATHPSQRMGVPTALKKLEAVEKAQSVAAVNPQAPESAGLLSRLDIIEHGQDVLLI